MNRHARRGAIIPIVVIAVVVLCVLLVLSSARQEERRELVLWTAFKDSEIAALEKVTAQFEGREHVHVRIVRVPFAELQPKIQVSVPVGQGPDLLTIPHDWLGLFHLAGIVQPMVVDPATLSSYLPISVEAMRYQGTLYGIPLSVSALGLVTNRALLASPPTTFADLIDKARALTHGDQYGFLFDDTDIYYAWPIFGGEGAFIFANGPNGPDPYKLGLDNEGAERAANLIADLHRKWHLIPDGTNKDSANNRFLAGKCAMTVTGPWSLQDYRNRNIDYTFTPLPPLDNGHWPQPLVGVDGVVLTSASKNPLLATKLALALADRETEVALWTAGGRIPARLDAQNDPRVARSPDMRGIALCVEKGIPMPSIPESDQVWQPMIDALKLITTGGAEPSAALHEAVERIIRNIHKMQE